MSSQPSTGTGELSAAERAFYSRQLIMPEMGYEAQLALKRARVVVPVSYTHLTLPTILLV